jgi:arsenate reductase (thioredoxin)
VEVTPRTTTCLTGVRRACAVALAALCVQEGIFAAPTSEAQDSTRRGKATTVLFMCPHGAAKSVLASAYFQRMAKERGLNVEVKSAGTDPDRHVSPAVAGHLKANGYRVPIAKPRRANADDMAAADVVISIGCDLKDLPTPRGTLVAWDDVPSPSEDFARADEKIRERVVALIDELVRKHNR